MPYGDEIWVNTGSGDSLLPDGTKPSPVAMLIHHQLGPFRFHKKHLSYKPLKLAWKLLTYNFIKISQGPLS